MYLTTTHPDTIADTKAARRLARLLTPAPAFRAHLAGSPERLKVEQYIAQQFRAVHGATIHDFMPVLLTMGCHGMTTAAAGVRAATNQALFLEQYLSRPVESSLTELAGHMVDRAGIAEIGNLVATQGGSSYLLFMVLTAVLQQAGFDWVVFTATPQVQKVLASLGLQIHALCEADPARLTHSDLAEWGRYYNSRPQVVAGNVAKAMQVLEQRTLYASILALFHTTIRALAAEIGRAHTQRGTFTLAA